MYKEISNLQTLLFAEEQLKIPAYQRPYKWSVKQVDQLIDDILHHRGQSAYRLGTMVVHREGVRNVVDGQQRLYTLTLLAADRKSVV